MDKPVRTDPTTTVTAREFANAVQPPNLQGLSEHDATALIADVERRGMELARRLGVDRDDQRLPAYIWAIVFGQPRS